MVLAGAAHLTIYTCFLAESNSFGGKNLTAEEKLSLGNGG